MDRLSKPSPAAATPMDSQRKLGAHNESVVLLALLRAGPAGILPGDLPRLVELPATTARATVHRLIASGRAHRQGERGRIWAVVQEARPAASPAVSGPTLATRSSSTAIVPAMRMEVSERGRFLVPAQPPTHCPPEHLPGGVELDQMLMHGALRPGKPYYCQAGCYLGQHTGMWRWTGRRFVPWASEPGSGESQLQGWLQRMMRGGTAAEAEAARAALEKVPAERRRRLLAP